jgi:hypothetical protein
METFKGYTQMSEDEYVFTDRVSVEIEIFGFCGPIKRTFLSKEEPISYVSMLGARTVFNAALY